MNTSAALVHQLYDAVRHQASVLRSSGSFGPTPRPHVRLAFAEFRYGPKGVEEYDLTSSPVVRETWTQETLDEAVAGMEQETRSVSTVLRDAGHNADAVERAVTRLTEWLMLDELTREQPTATELDRRGDLLARSLAGLPVPAWIEADLAGVAVLAPPMEIRAAGGVRVQLRAIGPDDLGGEIHAELAKSAEFRIRARPAAVLRLDYEAVGGEGWQVHLERAVAVLQLFGAGGVSWTRAETGSESLVDSHAWIMFLDQDGGSRRTYAISPEQAARLPRFWAEVEPALPESFYWHRPEDPAGLDSAWQNYVREISGIGYVNERIAAVVRSLESLFLGSDEKARIKATLVARTAMLLGACGFDAAAVQRTVALAYEVRSRFVHGAELPEVHRREIESEPGGIVGLLARLLEYNRAALVVTVLMRTDKAGLLRLLQDPAALRRCGDAYLRAHGR